MTLLRDISFLWSMIHVVALFLLLFEPRYSWRTTLLAGFAGASTLLIVNVLAMLWLGHGIIMTLAFFTCTIPTLILFLFLSKYRDGRVLLLFCLTVNTCFWLLQITNFLDRITGDTYVIMLISRLIIFPVAEYIFWRYLRIPYLELQNHLHKGWWWIAAIGATYYLLLMCTSVPVDTPLPDTAGLIRIALVMVLMPLTYLTILRSLWRQMTLYNNQQQVEHQRQDYNAILQKMEMEKIYRHDMRHHLLVLEAMLQQNDSANARIYINELNGRLTGLAQKVWSANMPVNAVLAAYMAKAETADCKIQLNVNIPAKLPYDEMDLCIIIGNALDNAIQACRNITDTAQRKIDFQLDLSDNQRLRLSISNACPQPPKFNKDGLPIQTRPKDGHGFGLRSIKHLANQYGGLLNCQWANATFHLNIVLFPLKNETTDL